MSLPITAAPPMPWQRLSPRMLLVHPVHEVLRQLPLLIGTLVLGSATGNPWWGVLVLVASVTFGILRWFLTTYRIAPEEIQLRSGVLRRTVCRCRATESARCPPTPGCCTACWA